EREHQWFLAHEPARERELLPLAEADLDPAGPRRPELRLETRRQPHDDVVCSSPADGGDDGRLIVHARHVADTDGVPREKLEFEEVLEGAGQPCAPAVGLDAGEVHIIYIDVSG